jgi:hypothetical protein
MSRTRTGSKGPGYDYWGRRALSVDCGHGRDVKKITHGIERAREHELIQDEIEEMADEDAADTGP